MMCEQISTAAGVLVTTSSLATAVTASSAVGSVAGHTAPQTTHRQWSSSSHRSGAGTAGHRSSHADTRDDISAQVQAQTAYYKRQLEITEQQHQMFREHNQKSMQLLELQEQYYAAKLRKITDE